MRAGLRDEIGAPATAERRALQRRNRELLEEFVQNCQAIAQLQGVELALGLALVAAAPDTPSTNGHRLTVPEFARGEPCDG